MSDDVVYSLYQILRDILLYIVLIGVQNTLTTTHTKKKVRVKHKFAYNFWLMFSTIDNFNSFYSPLEPSYINNVYTFRCAVTFGNVNVFVRF